MRVLLKLNFTKTAKPRRESVICGHLAHVSQIYGSIKYFGTDASGSLDFQTLTTARERRAGVHRLYSDLLYALHARSSHAK